MRLPPGRAFRVYPKRSFLALFTRDKKQRYKQKDPTSEIGCVPATYSRGRAGRLFLRDSCCWEGWRDVGRALDWESGGFHIGFLVFEARGLDSVISKSSMMEMGS